MQEIQQILAAQPTSSGATNLMKLYQQLTGNKVQVGCLCKSTNVNKVYSIVSEWLSTQNNG